MKKYKSETEMIKKIDKTQKDKEDNGNSKNKIKNIPNNRVDKKFYDLHLKNKKALIVYVVAGYPDIQTSEEIISCLIESGVDIIEIGIPFSEPIADGPIIQEAIYQSLSNQTNPMECLKLCERIRKKYQDIPIIIMTYANILEKYGFIKFLKISKRIGIDGFILPDMPLEESRNYVKNANKLDLSTIFLVSPNTKEERLNKIIERTSGFLYLVSVFGTTGERISFENYTFQSIQKVKQKTLNKIPLAVGFGISNPEQARLIMDKGADAIIIGSAIVKKINEIKNKKTMLKEIKYFVSSIKTIIT